MLRIESLTRRFGSLAAVDGVSLEVGEGQMLGIIGSSGAGKSTLLRLISRLIDPSGGRIWFGTTEVSALKGAALLDWRSRCAMIFQQFNLVRRLDVLTNVLMGRLRRHGTLPSLLGCFSREERAMAIRALDRVEIADQALKRCDRLSGGQQQRVAIARALMQEPTLLLADEPIASLDPRSAARVMETLRAINRSDGITVIASIHHLAAARAYCGRIVGMRLGRVVFDGRPQELTPAAVRAIYSVEDLEEELEQEAESLALAAAGVG